MNTNRPARPAAILRTALRSLLSPLGDFLYPPVCFLCSEALAPRASVVCPACWSTFPPAGAGDPSWAGVRDRLLDGGEIDEIAACYFFEHTGALKEAVHLLKYRSVRSLGLRFGEELGRRIAPDPRFARADLLVPVPLHRARRRERGYNQSELLCEGISRVTTIPVNARLLRRTRYTEPQTLLDADIRRRNIAGAFSLDAAHARSCAGARIILVDDVATTGATLGACARVLRRAGAASISAACVAVAR